MPKPKRKRQNANSDVVQEFQSKDSISDLNDDILFEIVKMLPKAQWSSLESVSHQIRNIVFRAWRSEKSYHFGEDFIFNEREKQQNPNVVLQSFLEKLLRCSPTLEEITGLAAFWDDENRNDKPETFRLLNQFVSFRRICFAGCQLKCEEIARFLPLSENRHADTLKYVDLSGVTIDEVVTKKNQAVNLDDSLPVNVKGLWCDFIWRRGSYSFEQIANFSTLIALGICDKYYSRITPPRSVGH